MLARLDSGPRLGTGAPAARAPAPPGAIDALPGADAADHGTGLAIIYNPTAGPRRRRLVDAVIAELRARGVPPRLLATDAPGDAVTLARSAACGGAGVVVAAGGDGTINEVANGIAGTDAVLGVIPTGTANVLAHELGLPFAPGPTAAMLAGRHSRILWPGRAENERGSRLFLQMLGVGFDAAVVAGVQPGLKRVLGKGAYVIEMARQLARYDFPPLRLIVDGATLSAASMVAAKGRYYGGRFVLAPCARPGERGFQLALFERGGAAAAMRYAIALGLGRLAQRRDLRIQPASQIDIVAPANLPVQADGELIMATPLAIGPAPAPIRVLVP